jgi:threonine synthase
VIAVQAFGASPEADATVFATLAEVGVARDRALSITAHAYDPWALDGAKTIAFEIAEALNAAPDRVYVPAGGGGLALSIARGFREWPHFAVVQAEGCAPVVASWRRGTPLAPVRAVTTAISGVQLADPPDGDALLAALRQGQGSARAVPDEAVYAARARLAAEEGLLVEPAAALALAGLLADLEDGSLSPAAAIVCVLTGSGSKDRAALERLARHRPPFEPIPLPALGDALLTARL